MAPRAGRDPGGRDRATVLADWGADVIKVEHPTGGDPLRGLLTSGMLPGGTGVNYMIEHASRGKRSVAADLATPGGHEVLRRHAIFRERDCAEWAERLTANDCVWAPMQTPAEVARDVQVAADGYLVPGEHREHGAFHTVASPVQLGGQTVGTSRCAPDLGQHTETVLLDLGYTWKEIAKLKEPAAIG